ncbi:hypothetical protein [Nonomuraea aridisoli]|uniref:Uncharacterized protein n=1 Tax=Nonomuraea aridisoli TaxID=2070368 RepID=A0A2W2CML3_9ACTN|nr:hypothetical protein [Nonomuraea aridisoli]PZG00752.1 hypothetical protein C1J01_48220 [Nonomuraea aridisoli]
MTATLERCVGKGWRVLDITIGDVRPLLTLERDMTDREPVRAALAKIVKRLTRETALPKPVARRFPGRNAEPGRREQGAGA